MSYQVFARKYRPRTFKDVLGQDHVVRTLCNAIEQKRLAHAYLFVGPRGTGKTSTARIFAKALNCTGGPKVDFDPDEDVCVEIAEGRSLDVLEIDGASNRGIDNIRDLRDNVQFAPARGQYRIIYIDEVHMLTKESFNALLKTLEEPPAHVMFIFATTEPHKILSTILSRCQRFDLRPIPADIIAKHLVDIAGREGVQLSEEAAYAIATVADGGMRDAQSMLDQLVSFCGDNITEENVRDIFGITGRETVARAVAYMLARELPSLLRLVGELSESGRDMGQFLSEMMGSVRELLVAKVAPEEGGVNVPPAWRETLMQHISRIPLDKIVSLMEALSTAEEQMRWSTNKRLHMEMGLIQAVHSLSQANISDIIRALNGAPIPETPIATTVLPDIPLPGPAGESSRATSRKATTEEKVESAPRTQTAPKPELKPEPSGSAPEQQKETEKQSETVAPETLEPIDDAPPLFDDMPSAAPSVESHTMSEADWEAILSAARERSPLKVGSVGSTLFIGEDDGLVTVAIHPTDTDSRDALLSEDVGEMLREEAQRRGTRLARLRIVTDDSVPLPEEEPEEPTPSVSQAPEETEPEPKKELAKKGTAKSAVKKEEVPTRESKAALSAEEFYKDPLIELAINEFHAKLIK